MKIHIIICVVISAIIVKTSSS